MSRLVFGIHSVTPYNRTTQKPYGILKVIGGGNLEMTGETEDLFGGSSKFAYASEQTQIGASMTMNVKSYPNFLMELFLGGSVSTQVASSAGEIRNFANSVGTSVQSATTGIDSVSVTSADAADLKFGRYVIEATAVDEVDVYIMTDIDFSRGNAGSYADAAKMTIAEGVAVTASTATALADYGLDINGGSGTIGMTVGDIAVFDVFPPHTGISEISVGSDTAIFPSFGAFMLAQKRSNGEIFQLQAFNCVGSGMPFPLQEKTWMVSDLTVKVLRDETEDKVLKITAFQEVV